MSILRRLLPIALLILLPAVAAHAEEGRLTLLSGESHRRVTVTSITHKRIRFTLPGGEEQVADMSDLVSLSILRPENDQPLSQDEDFVEVHLRGGDVVLGSLAAGEEEELALHSEYIGPVRFDVDDIEEVRFVKAWREALEKPAPATDENELDVFTYRSLDHVTGTFLRLTGSSVVVHGKNGETNPIYFGNLLTIRFADFPAPESPKTRLAVLRLADGSKLTLTEVTSDGKMVRGTTIRGKKVALHLLDVLALYQKGGRFVYLSDLTPAETVIVPWIGEAHAWDRPRFDRSFLDGPLVSGGEAFLKGLGVISGTTLKFDLSGSYRLFTGRIALDDTAGEEGDVIFEVLVDGESRYKSKVIKRLGSGAEPPRIPPINVAGAKTLSLEVTYVDDFVRDFANWLEPMLIK
jgi:NPCBM/NEW2 domain